MIQQFNVFCVHDSDIWACGEPNEVTPEPQGIDSATEEEISSPPAPAHAPVQQAEEYMMEGPRMSPPMNGYAMHGPPPPGSGYGNGHMNGSSPPPPGPGYGPMHPPPPGSGYSPMNGPPQNGFGYGPGNGMSPGGPGFSPVMNSSGYNGPGMGQDWQADMVIGVDFGMTCTAVAWSMGPEWADPKTIQRWPGKMGHELRNKVDSSVSYDFYTGHVTSWGFLCNADDERFEYNSLFKLYLDPEYRDNIEDAPSTLEARTWYHDYLACLYRYIMQTFTESFANFDRKRIEFAFSVPVTWRKNPAMLAEMEKIIRRAGFGSNQMQRASISLTEAEAAAIYASKQSMERGEVFLVCDAGGGTTDLNVLKVENASRGQMELNPLSWTEGEAVGSTLIDWKVRNMIKERLATIQQHLQGELDTVISRMMADKFETFKCSFGSLGMDVPKLFLPIPGLGPGMDFPQARIEDSRMIITREELQAVFDDQVNKMCNLIDRQIRLVAERHANESISYLVLSGGLGSSPYVQSRIKARYETSWGGRSPGVGDLKVLLANEPQLTVAHGLVMSKSQTTRGGPDMYSLRCCPVSFGIVCREVYDPAKHVGEDIVEDPYDGRKWAERQINWIITQGQVVRANTGASQRYRLKIDMGKEREPWKTRIVMSHLPVHQLPTSLKRAGAREICGVEAVLNPRDMKRKNRHWYDVGKEYNRAEFEVRMIIGAGLRFEIWSKDGIRSREHDEIDVRWEGVEERMPQMPPSEQGTTIYRW